ncbi:MAG: molybdopterin-dependent oxidoreductase, partial [Planctomycetota bacterium]|nr:molybdopterin-dependent oxidoreductase [Planctomycetota bacterium]
GCRPQGQCGCCLALVDGKPLVTCALGAERAEGRAVETMEGLDEAVRRQVAAAFVGAGGLQCGFCIPGIALRAHHFVQGNQEPSRAEIARALDVHLCRCTGYVKIIDAVEELARLRRVGGAPTESDGAAAEAACEHSGVGARVPRYGGVELVLGERAFTGDIRRASQLHGALRLADHPRALVRAIDTSRAAALPGVVCVATAADVPGERVYGLIEQDWPGFAAVGEEVRCVGDVLVAVAAEDEATARAAAQLVEIDYEVREPVLTTEDSLAEQAPQVNPAYDNQLSRTVIRFEDAEAALTASTHVVRESFQTQRIEHLFMEPECAVAEPRPGGGLHLWTQGQGIFDDRRQVAAFLGLAEEKVSVELVPNGGAFGGKEDMSVQAQTCLLAWLTQRPVRLALSREESVRLHPKRHPIELDYELGCDAEGKLTALRARIVGDTGAYASVGAKVLERAAGHASGPYRVPAVDVVALAAATNNPPCGAMRGFGANQANFALESCLDRLAEKVGLDRFEMRLRNVVGVGDRLGNGQVLEASVGIGATLDAVRPAWEAARAAGKAVGIACGIKNSGIGNGVEEWGKARLVVEGDGSVTLFNGYTEMGQGLLTVLGQIAAEVTGLSASTFHGRVDTTFALGCGQTTGSRATLIGGRAVQSAAEKLRAALDEGRTLEEMIGEVFAADIVVDDTTAPQDTSRPAKPHTAYGYATQVCILDGEGRVERIVAAHDVGRAINPELVEGQIEGAVHMGLGYALTEELPCENGWPVTHRLREIGVLRARDMPEVEVLIVEDPEPAGPFGAKGVGEIGLVPTASAVAGALRDFDGVERCRLPMKDSPAARAMSVGRIKQRAGKGAQP